MQVVVSPTSRLHPGPLYEQDGNHQCNINTDCAQNGLSDFGIEVKMAQKSSRQQNDTLFVHSFLSLT